MNKLTFIATLTVVFLAACKTVPPAEKLVDIPNHQWRQKDKVTLEMDVTDSALYNIYFIFRHTQQYPYGNILVNISVKDTANRAIGSFRLNVPLTSDKGEWAGQNIDDLYDHQVKCTKALPLYKNRYLFTIEQLMNEDPLPYVLNTGIAISKQGAQ